MNEESDAGSRILSGLWSDWWNKRDCSKNEYKDMCPCAVWNKIKTVPTDGEMDVIVAPHRGIWGYESAGGPPENSRKAIQEMGKENIERRIVEIDVMGTKDSMVVLSHDYSLSRLSNFTTPDKEIHWFDQNWRIQPNKSTRDFSLIALLAAIPILGWRYYQNAYHNNQVDFPTSQIPPALAFLKMRNGDIDEDSPYLLFNDALDALKKNEIVALIDIKAITNDYDGNYHPSPPFLKEEYERRRPEGREKVKEDWLSVFRKCYEIASKKGLLDYIAFKTDYMYEEIIDVANGISKEQAKYVRFMPMVQPINKKNSTDTTGVWDIDHALGFIDSWTSKEVPEEIKNNIIAIETNFNFPKGEYFEPFNHNQIDYVNLFDYVHKKGYRPGIFSEEPVGVRGVADRYGRWQMPNLYEKKKADHLILMNVPYFNGAVITTDRPDIWKQFMSSTQLRSSEIPEKLTVTTSIENLEQSEITAKYQHSSIIVDGLNNNDIGNNLILYDLQGRLIFNDKIKIVPRMIIEKDLHTGVYILRISGNRHSSIKLIAN
jgi:hypothetical protein